MDGAVIIAARCCNGDEKQYLIKLMAKIPTIKIEGYTISLNKKQEWVARKDRKVVARNDDWILLMRTLNIKSDTK